MTRTTFTPRPSPSPEPILRPASPKLPQPVGAPVTRHKTLPYGVPAVPRMQHAFASGVQVRETSFVPPVAVDSVFTDTQKLVALTWMDPNSDEPLLPSAPSMFEAIQRYIPLGVAAGVGFLVAYLL